jgi:hypothetical protein
MVVAAARLLSAGELLLLGYSSPRRQGEVNQLYYQSLLLLQQWPIESTSIDVVFVIIVVK